MLSAACSEPICKTRPSIPITYPRVASLETYYDPKLKLVKQFKMRGLPTSILIDKNGNEFGRVIGEVDFVSDDFISLIKKYI